MGLSTVTEKVADPSFEVLLDFVSKELAAVEDFEETDTQAAEHRLIFHPVTVGPNHLSRNEKQSALRRFDGHAEDTTWFRLLGAPNEGTSKTEVLGFTVDERVGQ